MRMPGHVLGLEAGSGRVLSISRMAGYDWMLVKQHIYGRLSLTIHFIGQCIKLVALR